MDELFNIIGRLYADIYNTQRVLEMLQEQLKAKDQEILELKKTKLSNDKSGS
jgi:hypothetical protein